MRHTEKKKNITMDSFIGPNTAFEGKICSEGSVCVEGSLRGGIEATGEVIVGRQSRVKGDIKAESVAVGGHVVGNIISPSGLEISATGRVTGDIQATTICLTPGGVLDGSSKMTERVKVADTKSAAVRPADLHPDPKLIEQQRKKRISARNHRLLSPSLTVSILMVLIMPLLAWAYFQQHWQRPPMTQQRAQTEQPAPSLAIEQEKPSARTELDFATQLPSAIPVMQQSKTEIQPEESTMGMGSNGSSLGTHVEKPAVQSLNNGKSFRFKFKLVNPTHGEPIAGSVVIIAALKPPHNPEFISFPRMELDADGMPVRLKKASRFRIRYFKNVSAEFSFPFSQVDSFRILIHDRDDQPIDESTLLSEELALL
ncbi:MAG: polymer-forming cytoskeletal protein [Deltaproteobacteria bacterium]|nr:MAG: polymer-forming cytoskeletal protein [Deltaproteobacteria bacterium]